MVRNGQLVTESGYVTEVITNEALRLMNRYAEDSYPFYLSVHYTAPHHPWIGEHPQDVIDSYDECPFVSCPQEPRHPWAPTTTGLTSKYLGDREALKGYFAAVTAMDQQIGHLLDQLEELGIRDDTLVVFLSDNGFSCGHHGFWGKGNGTGPRNMYENSIKVPAIFSHPGRIPQGHIEDAMVSAYDFMPTLLDYLALPLPEGRNLPGTSFLPVLEGEPLADRECVVIYDEYGPVRMIRTREWKYVHRHSHGPHELYHLAEDPDERQNLVNDPGQQERVTDMKIAMDAWFARYVKPGRDGLREDGTQHGQTRHVR